MITVPLRRRSLEEAPTKKSYLQSQLGSAVRTQGIDHTCEFGSQTAKSWEVKTKVTFVDSPGPRSATWMPLSCLNGSEKLFGYPIYNCTISVPPTIPVFWIVALIEITSSNLLTRDLIDSVVDLLWSDFGFSGISAVWLVIFPTSLTVENSLFIFSIFADSLSVTPHSALLRRWPVLWPLLSVRLISKIWRLLYWKVVYDRPWPKGYRGATSCASYHLMLGQIWSCHKLDIVRTELWRNSWDVEKR